MSTLAGKHVVIVGAGEGVGREMILAANSAGAKTLAVARRPEPLAALAASIPGVLTLAADGVDESTPQRVLEALSPDVLVVCGGAEPGTISLQDRTWESFSAVWENDVHTSFNFVKTALTKPLKHGSTVVIVSSGAGLVGSPLSGGYAGSKRMQMFMAEYAAEESERNNLGIRFIGLVPRYIMTGTAVGKAAAEGYARYRNVTIEQFQSGFPRPQTPADVANAFVTLLTETPARSGAVFAVDGIGITEIP
jgi:NAD(P)-dependent dehydrogenase (short-subunit alcohol dehydrogenase family)